MKNIEPSVYRQRLIIEGHFKIQFKSNDIKEYLNTLSDLLSMTIFAGPYCWPPDDRSHPEIELVDLNGFIAWKESGCHVYAFNKSSFFTADIYSCKAYDIITVVDYTKNFIKSDDLIFKEV